MTWQALKSVHYGTDLAEIKVGICIQQDTFSSCDTHPILITIPLIS